MLKRTDKISSNRIAANLSAQNDVIQTSEQKQTKQNAFSHFRSTKQSFLIKPLFLNVCTRNKPNINTFEQQITKKYFVVIIYMSSIDHTNTPPDNPQTPNSITLPKAITIGTLTDCISNIGQGLKPPNPHIVKNPEAIKNDTNSNKIRRLIELPDWNAIKNFLNTGTASEKIFQ